MFKKLGVLIAAVMLAAVASAEPSPQAPGSASPDAGPKAPPSPLVLPTAPPGPVPPGVLAYPQGIIMDAQGDLIVSDKDASAIFRIAPDKKVTLIGQWSPDLKKQSLGPWIYSNFQGVLLDRDGSLVSPDPSARTLWRVAPDGNITKIVQDFVNLDIIHGI